MFFYCIYMIIRLRFTYIEQSSAEELTAWYSRNDNNNAKDTIVDDILSKTRTLHRIYATWNRRNGIQYQENILKLKRIKLYF